MRPESRAATAASAPSPAQEQYVGNPKREPTLKAQHAMAIFASFAFAYFFSALLRAVTATLAPVFSHELSLTAADLGLLAGAYFLGFSALQLPLGQALDRWGPRRCILVLLAVAVVGCMAFALARDLRSLIVARVLIGAGLAAALMAPLTCFRRLFSPAAQLRANSWMLMTGSLGMLASTLPVQRLLPHTGWRGLFWIVAGLLVAAMLWLAFQVPRDTRAPAHRADAVGGRYVDIVRHPLFVRMAPLGFFLYGGMIAVQSLWAGPWLTRVCGFTADQAAQGLFVINLSMLFTFLTWGAAMPWLSRRGFGAVRLMRWGLPLPLLLTAFNVWQGSAAGAGHWAAWCVACTFVSVSQPAVGAAFAPQLAGRALSAFNLVIFSGVFVLQWGLGLLIDLLQALALTTVDAFRLAFLMHGLCCACAYVWFLWRRS